MTLPTQGTISIGQVSVELGVALPLSLGDPRVRTLAGVASGPISLSQLRGKSATSTAPVPPPLTVSKQDASGSSVSTTGGGTVSCGPTVAESGGVPPYARTWSFTSNPNGCVLANANSNTCTVSRTYGKLSDGSATAVLQCVSTDSAGASVTTSNINAYLDWESNR